MSRARGMPTRNERTLAEIGLRQRAIGFAFRLYKSLVSPLIQTVSPSRCLYLPTCSEYAYTALLRFGIIRGSWLALRRLSRCHPWGKGGLDALPGSGLRAVSNPVRTSVACAGQADANHLP